MESPTEASGYGLGLDPRETPHSLAQGRHQSGLTAGSDSYQNLLPNPSGLGP